MIRKAIIPAAGFGTRFLPASKAQPKEMLPIVDTPTIQYVVEEAVRSGITDILIVIGKGKHAIMDHFDRSYELEAELQEKQKNAELKTIRRLSELADIHFIRQKSLDGLGDAVSYARYHVGDEPFAVMLGDTLLDHSKPVTRQMIEVYNEYGGSVVALESVPRQKVSRYGIISGKTVKKDLRQIDGFIEKPSVKEAPSNLAIAGRYVLTPRVFECIEKTKPGKNNEIQLTDALRDLLNYQPIYGLRFQGKRYDIGSKIDFLKTNIEFGLKRKDLGKDLKAYIKKIAKTI